MPRRRSANTGTIRKLPSGKHQAKIKVAGTYHPAPHTFDTAAAARAWLATQHRALDAGTWEPPARDTGGDGHAPRLADYAEQWLPVRDLKPRTRAHYRKLLDERILPDLGARRLDAITVPMVRDWYAGLDGGTPTARAHAYGLLRTILGSAYADDLIGANPCRIRGAGQVKRKTTTTIPTPDQVQALADAMPSTKYRVMVLVAAWCGLRFGELTELRPTDFTLEGKIPVAVSVSRAVTRVDKAFVVGEPKSDAGRRTVVIPPHIRGDLARHLRTAHGQDLVFPARNGGHMAPSSLYRVFYRARDAVGLDGLRWHDLRHFAGTQAAIVGATLAEVMARLGHSTSAAAMRYQGVAAGRDQVIAEALSDNVVPIRRDVS